MRHHVVFVGRTRWLGSGRLRRLCREPRIASARRIPISVPFQPVAVRDATIVMIQFRPDARRAGAVVRAIRGPDRSPRCIAVTPTAWASLLRYCIELDVWGYVLECAGAEDYLGVIDRVAAGRLVYPQDILDRIVTSGGRMTVAPA